MSENKYEKRINDVADYIEQNIDSEFSLDKLAAISHFSKFHFSRIFHGYTGETPFQMILRIRLERAASLLIHSRDTISTIAYNCGFNNLAVFSKNFKSYFHQSATSYRQKNSNLNKMNENLCSELYNRTKSNRPNFKLVKNESVAVKELAQRSLVYLRHIGPYQGDTLLFKRLFEKLYGWAGTKGLLERSDLKSVVVYHDDAYVADQSKMRTSVCITADPETELEEPFGKMSIDKGKYVVARFHVSSDQFQLAWDWLMGKWFPQSNYQPDDKICFELYHGEAKNGVFKVDLCVPVRRI